MSKASWLFAAVFLAAVMFVGARSDRLISGYAYKEDMATAVASTIAALLAVTLVVERAMTVINALVFGEEQRDAREELRMGELGSVKRVQSVTGNKERVRLLGAFIVGLFISAAGVRTLEDLVVVDAENVLLFPVDVILTAALIAGGSNGLSFLTQLAKIKLTPPPPPPPAVLGGALGDIGEADLAAATAASDPYYEARIATTG